MDSFRKGDIVLLYSGDLGIVMSDCVVNERFESTDCWVDKDGTYVIKVKNPGSIGFVDLDMGDTLPELRNYQTVVEVLDNILDNEESEILEQLSKLGDRAKNFLKSLL